MDTMYHAELACDQGTKSIDVSCVDVTNLDERLDILTISTFWNGYQNTRGTLIGALGRTLGIDVYRLVSHPAIDARRCGHVWLSDRLPDGLARRTNICRIGDMELLPLLGGREGADAEELAIRCFRSYFRMLDLAAACGVPMETIGMPLVGTGNQRLSPDFVTPPLITECVEFLRRNHAARRIVFIERSQGKAFQMAQRLSESYTLLQTQRAPGEAGEERSAAKRGDARLDDTEPRGVTGDSGRRDGAAVSEESVTPRMEPDGGAAQEQPQAISAEGAHGAVKLGPKGKPDVFISYNHRDYEVAKSLCAILEHRGFRCWYAPRNIQSGVYSEAICTAIEEARYFVLLLSANSIKSHHVLNELALAFDQLDRGHSIIPVRIDPVEEFPGSFTYYLHSMQVKDAYEKPFEKSIDPVISDVFER